MAFREAIWLFPFAFVVHVLEEWPRFVRWAQTYASAGFTARDYLRVHLAGIVLNFVVAALVWRFPNRVVVALAFALVLLPGLFWNTFFHAGATVWSGEYCPGVASAVVIYLPLVIWLCSRALAERAITPAVLIASAIGAAAIHVLDVGHNVFRRW